MRNTLASDILKDEQASTSKISQLLALVGSYKEELQTLNTEYKAKNTQRTAALDTVEGNKTGASSGESFSDDILDFWGFD